MKTEGEARIEGEANEFARRNKKLIANRLTDPKVFGPESHPVSVFMAGSPGAGKTEASLSLLETLADGERIIRLDPDDLRVEFAAYDGTNAWLFQGAVSILIDKAMDCVYDNKQSFILDGTLSRYDIADRNIERSLKRGRHVTIIYVYQDPLQAWSFVQAREKAEGRRIRKQDFIDQYFLAREAVNRLKLKYGKGIKVDLLIKNNDASNLAYVANVDQIDSHVPEAYSRERLEQLLPDG